MPKELLRNVFMFEKFSEFELNAVTKLTEEKTYGKGDIIFSEGDPSTSMYFIKYGSVRITQTSPHGDEIEIRVFSTGSHFGEIGFVDGLKRSAGAEALEVTTILRIDFNKLTHFFESQPLAAVRFHRSVSQYLAKRLRSTTENLTFCREKNLSHG